MRNKLFCLLFFVSYFLISQVSINGIVIDGRSNQPLPFASIKSSSSSYALTSVHGEFSIHCKNYPVQLKVSYLGYQAKNIQINSKSAEKIEIVLDPKEENLAQVNLAVIENIASRTIKKAIRRKHQNNPKKALKF